MQTARIVRPSDYKSLTVSELRGAMASVATQITVHKSSFRLYTFMQSRYSDEGNIESMLKNFSMARRSALAIAALERCIPLLNRWIAFRTSRSH